MEERSVPLEGASAFWQLVLEAEILVGGCRRHDSDGRVRLQSHTVPYDRQAAISSLTTNVI